MDYPTSVAAKPFDKSDSSLRDVLRIIFKRKWLVFLFFVITTSAITALILLTTKPIYQARAQILISSAELALPTAGAEASRPSYSEEQITRTVELFAGRVLAERVVTAIGPTVLYQDLSDPPLGLFSPLDEPVQFEFAVGRLMENVSTDPAGRSSIINISFKHEDPEMASKVVNLLAEMYVDRHLGVQKNPRTSAFFEEQFKILKQKLKESEEKLEAFKQTHNIGPSIKDEQDRTLDQEGLLRTSLNETRSRQAEIESRLQQLRFQLANTARNPATVDAVQKKLANLEIQESELALRLTHENPTLRDLREEIRVLRDKLTKLEAASSYGSSSSGEGSLYGRLQEELLRSEAEQKALHAREQAQASKLREFQQRLGNLERSSTEFNSLHEQLRINQESYRLYLAKFEESRISKAMDEERIANVRVIEPAEPPLTPLNSKLKLKLLLGLLFGAAGSLALPFLLQFTSGRLDTADDVERYLELPVLASIPALEEK